MVIGVGEILGGVSAPTLAGRAADLHGMQWPMYIMAGCAAAGAFFALFLRETAPVKKSASAFRELTIPAFSTTRSFATEPRALTRSRRYRRARDAPATFILDSRRLAWRLVLAQAAAAARSAAARA